MKIKSIQIGEFKDLLVERIVYLEGREVAELRHVRVGEDLSGWPEEVRSLASFLWTDEVVVAYDAEVEKMARLMEEAK